MAVSSDSDSSASSSTSVNTASAQEQQSDEIVDDFDDLEDVVEREPVVYSSRRLTDQQRLRLAPTCVELTITNYDSDPRKGPHSVWFEGYGVIGLHTCFKLRRV